MCARPFSSLCGDFFALTGLAGDSVLSVPAPQNAPLDDDLEVGDVGVGSRRRLIAAKGV